jgi:1-acyl-sn-glycerol-3-phosphate acyltransferase
MKALQLSQQIGGAYWTRSTLWKQPLEEMRGDPVSRLLTRLVLMARRKYILDIEGEEYVARQQDPFILVANHSQYAEAIVMGALLAFLRRGRRVRFLADWNFALLPPVALLYKQAHCILLDQKPAKPKFLGIFKPLFVNEVSGFERARAALASGECVGIFPEGTTNRDPHQLLKGHSGAARLSLETGAPLVPTGIHYPGYTGVRRIGERAAAEIRFGPPLRPERACEKPLLRDVRQWHQEMMGAIANLCGKSQTTLRRHQRG